MGQAKLKGNLKERIAKAKEKLDALRPKKIICNQCSTEIIDIVDLETKGIQGIEAAFAGICPNCRGSTYAIKGKPEMVATFMQFIEEETGSESIINYQKADGTR